MRTRWRKYASLMVLCLPLAIKLLFFNRSSNENINEALLIVNNGSLENVDLHHLDVDEENEQYNIRSLSRSQVNFVGSYMAKRRPANLSYCSWQYDLPEKFNYLDQQLIASPESGPTGGPNAVLPFATRGDRNMTELPQVTLCSHATADQVYGIVELARRWEGPLGLSIFVPERDINLAIELLDLACHCEPSMYKVSVHLIFPREKPPSLHLSRPNGLPRSNCWTADFLSSKIIEKTDRHLMKILYPINVARNVVRSLAPTQRVLVSDIELLPSKHLATRFAAMVKDRAPKRAIAFVLPVFEVESNLQPPVDKTQLLAALRAGRAVYFHRFSCSHCQKFPGLTRWILRPDLGRVRPLIITRREYPHNRWEPIFIGTKHDPFYAEEMTWEGRQDKMTQMFEMCLMNYRLIILDGAFLVHTPGIKRKISYDSEDELQKTYERKNARAYQKITHRLIKKYPTNHRCKP